MNKKIGNAALEAVNLAQPSDSVAIVVVTEGGETLIVERNDFELCAKVMMHRMLDIANEKCDYEPQDAMDAMFMTFQSWVDDWREANE